MPVAVAILFTSMVLPLIFALLEPALVSVTSIGIALRPLPLDDLDMFEGSQITIEVPFGFAHRDQLLSYMESKFPGVELSIVHHEVSDPTVSEVLFRHDSATEAGQTAFPSPGEDSEALLLKATDALSAFRKSND